MRAVLSRRIEVRGFIVYDFARHARAFHREMETWVAEGQVGFLEHRVDGLEAAPQALVDMPAGRNVGKVLVKVAADAPERCPADQSLSVVRSSSA